MVVMTYCKYRHINSRKTLENICNHHQSIRSYIVIWLPLSWYVKSAWYHRYFFGIAQHYYARYYEYKLRQARVLCLIYTYDTWGCTIPKGSAYISGKHKCLCYNLRICNTSGTLKICPNPKLTNQLAYM